MEQELKSLPELINSVSVQLSRLGFSPVTISRCNSVWQKLPSYSEARGQLRFTELLAKNFLQKAK